MNTINFINRGFRKFAGIFWKNNLNFDSNFKSNLANCEFDSQDKSKTSILNLREKSKFDEAKTGLMVQNLNNIYKYFDPKRKSYLDKLCPNSINNRVCKVEISANNPSEDRCNALQLKNLNAYFLAVYDGHGGGSMADYAKKELHKRFDENFLLLKEDLSIKTKEKIVLALHKAYEEIETELYKKAIEKYKDGECSWAYVGSCALTTIVHENTLIVANLGDCKARLFKKFIDGDKNFYEPIKLTITHNASKFYEQDKLKIKFKDEADIVVDKGRASYVKGRLQPTRTLGDFYLKKKEFNQPPTNADPRFLKRVIDNFNGPYIESNPDIHVIEINEEDEFLILATDGLWDWLESEEIAELINNNSNDKKSIAESLIKEALSRAAAQAEIKYEQLLHLPQEIKRSIHDDITVLVVDLKNQVVINKSAKIETKINV